MKIALIGSRSITVTVDEVLKALGSAGITLSEISGFISGGAIGADAVAPAVASALCVPFFCVRPDYSRYPSKVAPIMRNREIVEGSGFVLAFWDRQSKGTAAALKFAKRSKIPFFIVSPLDSQPRLF